MDVKCYFKKDVSKKTGEPYYYLYLPDLEKKVFLEPTEVKLLNLLGKTGKE